MSAPEGPAAYEFGVFRLEPRQRLLLSRETRQSIALPPKVFEMLLHLVEKRGQLVDKEELMKAVWPNVVVEENSLNRAISTLRRALGENPGEHRFIATQPGRGYRFVAQVEIVDGLSREPTTRGSAAITAAAPREAGPSIAVLPFANLTRDAEKEYFSDGMAEELIHRLARVPGMRVAARTSAFAYKGRSSDVRQIARELGVATVLEGSVRGAGERVRVTAQLVDGQTGYQLWSQSFDRDFSDLFRLQDELATAIVPALGTRMQVSLPAEATSAHSTESLEAYELYLQANAIRYRGSEDNMRRAVELFHRALELDPGFARARASLAQSYLTSVVASFQWPDALASAEREASRVLLLDPNLGAAELVLGQVSAYRGNWLAAEVHFKAAQARSVPDDDAPIRALFLCTVGFVEAGYREAVARFRAHPAASETSASVAVLSCIAGHDADARKYADLALSLGSAREGGVGLIYSHLARRQGRLQEAGERLLDALPKEILDAGIGKIVAQVYAAISDDKKGVAAAEALHEFQLRTASMESPLMVLLAMDWYTGLGVLDLAFDTAFKALDRFKRSETAGSWAAMWLPEMRPFHRDPRFQTFAEQLGLTEYWKQFGPPDHFEVRDGRLVCL